MIRASRLSGGRSSPSKDQSRLTSNLSYRVLTPALVGLPPTEYASLKLDTHRKPGFSGCPESSQR
jgi:hypothetical protein